MEDLIEEIIQEEIFDETDIISKTSFEFFFLYCLILNSHIVNSDCLVVWVVNYNRWDDVFLSRMQMPENMHGLIIFHPFAIAREMQEVLHTEFVHLYVLRLFKEH